jgi:transcription elongation factor Elf1
MKAQDDLLNCPHCGNNNVALFAVYGGDYPDDYEVQCGSCSLITKTKEEAVKAWNKRSNKHAEFVEELKRDLERKLEWLGDTAPRNDSQTSGREWEIIDMLNRIKEFEKKLANEK